jgi:acyl-CoA synthetase (AMP-forming)/AMP-acid ligase II
MATMDGEGRVRLVGRLKELIIRGGENIYPKEIEELLHQHDSVQEAFVSTFATWKSARKCWIQVHRVHTVSNAWEKVCGVPDDRLGEELCAWIKLKETPKDAPTVEQMQAFCRDKASESIQSLLNPDLVCPCLTDDATRIDRNWLIRQVRSTIDESQLVQVRIDFCDWVGALALSVRSCGKRRSKAVSSTISMIDLQDFRRWIDRRN